MSLKIFQEVAKKRGFEVDDLSATGQCELMFDEKHLVTVEADSSSILFKSDIVPLSSEGKERLQQQKLALKTSYALMKSTFCSPFIEKAEQKGMAVEQEGGAGGKGADEGVEWLRLVRRLEANGMPAFEVENELEGFLAALEVYKAKLKPRKSDPVKR